MAWSTNSTIVVTKIASEYPTTKKHVDIRWGISTWYGLLAIIKEFAKSCSKPLRSEPGKRKNYYNCAIRFGRQTTSSLSQKNTPEHPNNKKYVDLRWGIYTWYMDYLRQQKKMQNKFKTFENWIWANEKSIKIAQRHLNDKRLHRCQKNPPAHSKAKKYIGLRWGISTWHGLLAATNQIAKNCPNPLEIEAGK